MPFTFSLIEIANIVVMTLAVSFIFRKMFHLEKQMAFWPGMVQAGLVTAPGIILHEFGHKFVALAFGLTATFQVSPLWLGLGVFLTLVNAPFLFFVPAYIAIGGSATALQSALIAFSGPGVNLLLYLLALTILKTTKPAHKSAIFWTMTRKINGFLFVFNMIPIPPLDGYAVVAGMLKLIGI